MIRILTCNKCLLDDSIYTYYGNFDFVVLDHTKDMKGPSRRECTNITLSIRNW